MKTTRADWAASVPWTGITGKPGVFPSGPVDIGQLTAAGFSAGSVPIWNGSRFVPHTIPTPSPPSPSGTDIIDYNIPGVATRVWPMQGSGTVDLWYQEIFDLRQYGALPDGSTNNDIALERAIGALNNNGGGTLFFPGASGVYYFGSDAPEITVPCCVKGEGRGISRLHFPANGFTGGAGGNWFGASDLSLITDGTGGSAINLTDGTAGTAGFDFSGLEIAGFDTGIYVSAVDRYGFISRCKITPNVNALNINCVGLTASDLFMVNGGGTSAVAVLLQGNYHLLHGFRVISGISRWAKAASVSSGTGIAISNGVIIGTEQEMISLTDGTSGGPEVCRVQNISFSDVQGNPAVVFNPSLHYVNELHGLGNNADTSYDHRKELEAQVTWNPDSLRSLESTTVDVTLVGARVGDQVALGSPDATDYWQQSARVVADDTVRVTLTNCSLNTVDLESSVWKVRIFN